MLENLRMLKEDMVNKDWTICSFIYRYKKIEYIVLVKRFVGKEKKRNMYALIKLHFMKSIDLNDDLQVEANSQRLIIEVKELRKYFSIEYNENLGDILQQFIINLGESIPKTIPLVVTNGEKSAMVRSLSKSDSEDPDKIYCTKVRRNPGKDRRSEFNADKTKLLRNSLFEYFKNDATVSFCYSSDGSKENDDTTILRRFSKEGVKLNLERKG